MKYKKIAILNIVSILLILISAKMYFFANEQSSSLRKQLTLTQELKHTSNAVCNNDKVKNQLISFANAGYSAQSSFNSTISSTARLLLILGVSNIVLTIATVRKFKV